jgi:transcriptional regulator GlxA family with amidase domain
LWRNYSVESLAESSGFGNRQSFSNTFYEQNGIRPADFIKKRKEELELQNNFHDSSNISN